MTARELLVLIRQLPRDSALNRSQLGPAALWDTNSHLLALVADILSGGNWQRGGGKGPRPKPMQRPDPRAQQRRRQYVRRLQNLGLIDGG